MNPPAVCVTTEAAEAPLAREARRVLPDASFAVSDEDPLKLFPGLPPRQIVLLDRFRGGLVKAVNEAERSRPDRAEAYLACGFNCPGQCAYCVLRECATVPYPTLHANLDEMLAELEAHLAAEPDACLHLGHVLDPLAYPFLGPLLRGAIDALRSAPRARLEIRTKFAAIDLLPEGPPGNVVLAFSFSPPRVVACYERGTPGLAPRLAAACAAAQRGYRLGIRLDPVLLYKGWEADYAELCARILSALPRRMLEDAVIGCLRGPRALIERIGGEDPSWILRSGEYVAIGRGKVGYPRPSRIHALRFLSSRLGGRVPVRFCFEDAEVEASVFGRPPP